MNMKALCIAIALVCGISGCDRFVKGDSTHSEGDRRGGFKPTRNPPPRAPGDLDCKKGGPCDVVITVDVKGDWCRAQVSHEVIRVERGAPMEITWKLQAPAGYSFPPKDAPPGVFIKGPHDGTFKMKSQGATVFVLTNRAADHGVYDYGVFVYNTTTKYLCDLLDPVIINEM